MPTADELFRAELARRGIEYSATAEGQYSVEVNDRSVTVSLENVRRDYGRDGDADAITRFVDQVSEAIPNRAPAWNDVRPYVRYSLEPSDYAAGFDDVLHEPISEEMNQVFVYSSADGARITWINESLLDGWSVSRESVVREAESNMADIVARTTVETLERDGNKLGMLSTDETPFKASLILSRDFRQLVSPTLGWPVFVVVPCRDFAYVIPADNRDFLGRLGGVVVREYRESGYPITKDVLEVSDEGITAIGTYPDCE